MGGLSVGEGACRGAPAVAIKCDLPFSKKNLGDRIAMLRKEAEKDGVNLNTRGRASSGSGRALRERKAPLTKRLHTVAKEGGNGDPYDLTVKCWGRFISYMQKYRERHGFRDAEFWGMGGAEGGEASQPASHSVAQPASEPAAIQAATKAARQTSTQAGSQPASQPAATKPACQQPTNQPTTQPTNQPTSLLALVTANSSSGSLVTANSSSS